MAMASLLGGGDLVADGDLVVDGDVGDGDVGYLMVL
jgi:hypothetical protein